MLSLFRCYRYVAEMIIAFSAKNSAGVAQFRQLAKDTATNDPLSPWCSTSAARLDLDTLQISIAENQTI